MCECVKKNYDVVKQVAIKFSKLIKEDVHIYKATLGDDVIYDFEPAYIERDNVILLIPYTNE